MKDLLKLFNGLVEKPALFTQFLSLALGAVFILIGVGIEFNIINGEIKTDNTQKPILILVLVGVVLIGFYLWMVWYNEINNKKIAEKNREVDKIKSYLNTKNKEIYQLKHFIEKAISVIEDSNEESSFSERVLEILKGMSQSFEKLYSPSASHQKKVAAEWVSQSINKWTQEIKLKDCLSFGVTRKNIKDFRNDLAKLLELLCQNIINDRHSVPLLVNPQFYKTLGGNTIPYNKALIFIEKRMSEELDQEVDTLGFETIDYVKNKMAQLVEDTTYKP
ncbi:hypothetical protein [Moorena sp. SIO3A2]|uniref:hypothetical protein n=1 Tax=Moorena sp. SIO3A2 TaxID=2607841 RepID=UPI0013BD67B9|nr:hypothetical protein [Moorena sp. SIO3A2]NER86261.1 hypothetical protein [Moorena sp. SIO3A2]